MTIDDLLGFFQHGVISLWGHDIKGDRSDELNNYYPDKDTIFRIKNYKTNESFDYFLRNLPDEVKKKRVNLWNFFIDEFENKTILLIWVGE